MLEVDLGEQDETMIGLPSDIREDLATRGMSDLFVFGKGILGFSDMTENCHGPLTTFLDHNPSRFKGILMPRDHYKTSVVTVAGTMQRMVRNSEQRQLIRNESATNSANMLRAIRQHAESNRIFRALYSRVIPKDFRKVRWNDSDLDFNREGHYPEPSIRAAGLTSGTTSQHYTHITDDDLISEEAIASELVMASSIERVKAMTALLVKPETDTYWLVGTRWGLHDIYSWTRDTYGAMMAWFARGAIEEGKPIFPELLSLETLALKRRAMGEYKFSCLMMNNPRNADIQDLNVDDLLFFAWSADGKRIALLDKLGVVTISYNIDQLIITTTVDLAPAEKLTSDRNAVVTTGVTPCGKVVVLEAWGARCTPLELIDKIFSVNSRFHPKFVAIEDVAYQKAFKYFLKQECDNRETYIRIEPAKSTGKKELRIRGLQPVMATNRLYIDPVAHLLRNEMADFPLGEHDDVLDALSMQLQFLQGVLSPKKWLEYQQAEDALIARIKRGDTSMTPTSHEDQDAQEDILARTTESKFGRIFSTTGTERFE